MNRLDRYIFREIFAPTLVGFLAYTGFMLIRGLLQFSDLILQSDNPARDALRVLGFSIPHIVVLTIPVSLLLGLLIGIGRLSADSELTALRASGMDLVRLYRPIGLLSVLAFGTTIFLMVFTVPKTNQILYDLKLRLSTFVIAQKIQPGVFSPEFAGRRIYVEGASADRRTMTGVLVSDRSNPEQGEQLTIARRGTLELDDAEGQLWLRLEDAVVHHVPKDPASYDRITYQVQRVLLEDANPRDRLPQLSSDKQLREQSLSELLARTTSATKSIVDHRMTWVEIHKKFSLPAACLVFGLLGLPLGIVNRHGGRAAGFAISVAIVLGYYIFLAGGEARAIEGKASPLVAMWFPNFVLLVLGLLALLRVRKDRPLFPTLSFSSRASATAPRQDEPKPDSPFAAFAPPERAVARDRGWRMGLPIPDLLIDRYVAGRFLKIFLLVIVSILVLYVLIDYMEISDDIAKNHPAASLVLAYYQALIAPILLDIVPFAFLVAALIATAGLVRSSETTALLASGISLYRATASLLILAGFTGLGLFSFSERVVPLAATESQRLRDIILRHPPVIMSGTQNAWFRGSDGRFFSMETFDPATKVATGFTLLELDRESTRIIRRTFGRIARVIPGKGIEVSSGWTRSFGPLGEELFLLRPGTFVLAAPEASKVFYAGKSDPRQMSIRELRSFIESRTRAGADVAAPATGLYTKSATACAALLLTLLGLPFAFRYGKRGAVAGIGVALLLGLTYLFVSSFLVKFGEAGSLPPLLAAWGTNVLFGLGAVYGLLGIRT